MTSVWKQTAFFLEELHFARLLKKKKKKSHGALVSLQPPQCHQMSPPDRKRTRLPYWCVCEAEHSNPVVSLCELKTWKRQLLTPLGAEGESRSRLCYFEDQRFTLKKNRPQDASAQDTVSKTALEMNRCLRVVTEPTTCGGTRGGRVCHGLWEHRRWRGLCFWLKKMPTGTWSPAPVPYARTQSYILYL